MAKVAKKVLAILAGDKNGRKFLGYVVGIALFIVLLPVIAVYGLFGWMAGGGATEIVSPDMVYSAMPAEYRERMEQYNTELSIIETTFAECGVSGTDTSLAKTIYIWIETDENRLHSICSASKNIGRVLREYVWETSSSFVLTSGTMSDGVDFSFFEKENGIHQIAKMFRQTSMTASPFDYKNHTRLYMPKGIPLPENNSPEYIAAISDEIVKIVKATNGHAAILFTSYKVLEAVYRQTKDRLTQYELIRMTRSNKSAIADFKKSKNGVLFASGSMWEGVDCIGDCLSSVIIPRLPFPMRSATMESKKEECNGLGEFVNTICVPEMLIKLRQGLGRLIRCETDTGLISILDTRATTGKYADKVGNVLAKYTKAETLDEVEAFFREVKSPAYFEV